MKTNVVHAAGITSLIFGAGCQSVFTRDPDLKEAWEVFDFSGIPAKEYFVGGGYWIR